MKVVKIKILRWTCDATLWDKIRNEYIRGSLKVSNLFGKIKENRLMLFGYIKRKNNGDV